MNRQRVNEIVYSRGRRTPVDIPGIIFWSLCGIGAIIGFLVYVTEYA